MRRSKQRAILREAGARSSSYIYHRAFKNVERPLKDPARAHSLLPRARRRATAAAKPLSDDPRVACPADLLPSPVWCCWCTLQPKVWVFVEAGAGDEGCLGRVSGGSRFDGCARARARRQAAPCLTSVQPTVPLCAGSLPGPATAPGGNALLKNTTALLFAAGLARGMLHGEAASARPAVAFCDTSGRAGESARSCVAETAAAAFTHDGTSVGPFFDSHLSMRQLW